MGRQGKVCAGHRSDQCCAQCGIVHSIDKHADGRRASTHQLMGHKRLQREQLIGHRKLQRGTITATTFLACKIISLCKHIQLTGRCDLTSPAAAVSLPPTLAAAPVSLAGLPSGPVVGTFSAVADASAAAGEQGKWAAAHSENHHRTQRSTMSMSALYNAIRACTLTVYASTSAEHSRGTESDQRPYP